MKVYNKSVDQQEAQERFIDGATERGPGKLRAWNDLSLEEKRLHRRHVRRFRARLYQENVYDGLTIQELADKYKITRAYVITHIQRFTAALAKKQQFNIPAERIEQYHKLKALLEAVYKRALSGDDFAIKSYVSLSARFAKVIGLDAPTRFEHKVDKKTTHVVEHTVDIEDLAKRIELVRHRKSLLEKQKLVAGPFSDNDSGRLIPVSEESHKNGHNGVALSPTSPDLEALEASWETTPPEKLAVTAIPLNPVPVPDYSPNVTPENITTPKPLKHGGQLIEIPPQMLVDDDEDEE